MKFIKTAIILYLLAAVSAFGQPSPDQKADSLLKRAGLLPLDQVKRYEMTLEAARLLRDSHPTRSAALAAKTYHYAVIHKLPALKMKAANAQGAALSLTGNMEDALVLLLESLSISDSLKDQNWQIQNLNTLGISYYEQESYQKALSYWKQAKAKLQLTPNDTLELAKNYNNIGLVFNDMQQPDSAIYYFHQSLKLSRAMGNELGIALNYNNLGSAFTSLQQYDSALYYLKRAWKRAHDIQNARGEAFTLLSLGKAYNALGKYATAYQYLRRGLSIAEKSEVTSQLRDLYEALSKNAEKRYRFQEAYQYYQKFKQYSDSVVNEKSAAREAELRMVYHTEKTEKENALLRLQNQENQKAMELQQGRIKRQRIVLWSSLAIGVLVLLGALSVYKNYRQRKGAQESLEQLNQKIDKQKAEMSLQANALKEAKSSLQGLNHNLETAVNKRTRQLEVQNEKLRKYAYSHSHELRAPLARIMGLIHIMKKGLPEEEVPEYLDKLDKATQEMDEVIREISASLQQEFADKTPEAHPKEV